VPQKLGFVVEQALSKSGCKEVCEKEMGNLGMKLKGTQALTEQMHLKCNEDEKYYMADALDELKAVS
jgi:hypothetical protein